MLTEFLIQNQWPKNSWMGEKVAINQDYQGWSAIKAKGDSCLVHTCSLMTHSMTIKKSSENICLQYTQVVHCKEESINECDKVKKLIRKNKRLIATLLIIIFNFIATNDTTK